MTNKFLRLLNSTDVPRPGDIVTCRIFEPVPAWMVVDYLNDRLIGVFDNNDLPENCLIWREDNTATIPMTHADDPAIEPTRVLYAVERNHACSTCSAPRGVRCRTIDGRETRMPHKARLELHGKR